MRKPLFFLIFVITAFSPVIYGRSCESAARSWLEQNQEFAASKLLQHMSPSDGLPGAVIAAPSRLEPDYYYHWVRDAALVTDALMSFYDHSSDQSLNSKIRRQINAYIDYSNHIQLVTSQTGLGEPKFYVNGNAYQQPWGRPQNDGPALRAISMIHWARIQMKNGNEKFVREKLYTGTYPASSPIKKDLEYISHHWKDSSFDLWEEVKGSHFYTLMVTRKALIQGYQLASALHDDGAAKWYINQAKEIEYELNNFWDDKRQYFITTINQSGGLTYKTSNLDVAVILGLLHGDMHDGFLPWDDARVINTINSLVASFKQQYRINMQGSIPGVAIGRYPEDRYAGTHFDGGNPWPLCTLAIAEALYRYAYTLKEKGRIIYADAVLARADEFVQRVSFHSHANGDLDEQIDRDTGQMTSAPDLGWNYAAMLTTSLSASGHLWP